MDIIFKVFLIIVILVCVFGLAGILTYIHFGDKKFKPQVKHLDGDIKFTIECTMKARWVPHFLAMLKYMQSLGGMGSSREVALYADGDGDFHPHFNWDRSLVDNANPVRDKNGDVMYDAG